jgi:ubiquinone biosynthesis protein
MHLRPRHLRRYREIVEILIDNGFGALLKKLGVSERLNIPRWAFRGKPLPKEELSHAQRLRTTLEELGPTFIKLGQLLSTRSDLLPPEYLIELRLLQDEVPPAPWDEIKVEIESELDAPIEDIFEFIDHTPLASASLAQVHAARLLSGDSVVVKVQRPHVEETVNLDLDILYDLASLAQNRTAIGERYSASDLADEFSYALRDELDFRREGRNMDQFRENFKGQEHIYVPQVYWDYTTQRVIIQEHIRGIKIDDIDFLDQAGYDRHRLADYAADFVLKEILEDGFFHADPHPGNILVLRGEKLGILDFGTVGRLEKNDRANLARLLITVIQMDFDGIVNQLMRMGIADYNVDQEQLERDLRRLLIRYYDLPLQEIPAAEVVKGLEPIIYKHHLRIPSDYWLLIKTIVLMQGVGLTLDPDFDIFAAAKPYIGRLLKQIWMPSNLGSSALRLFTDWNDLISDLPRQTNRIMSQIEHGDLEVKIEILDLMQLLNRVDFLANRLIYGILIAALILASAVLIPRLDFTWPWSFVTWIVLFGFGVLVVLGIQLLWSIFRSGRTPKNRK